MATGKEIIEDLERKHSAGTMAATLEHHWPTVKTALQLYDVCNRVAAGESIDDIEAEMEIEVVSRDTIEARDEEQRRKRDS